MPYYVSNIMSKGTVEDRARAILKAMVLDHYTLREGTIRGVPTTVLFSDDDEWSAVIPREVMVYLVDHDMIQPAGGAW